ncbi:MAG: hypothetical protein ABL966_08970, partial [Acidimicrobiales bacterium]
AESMVNQTVPSAAIANAVGMSFFSSIAYSTKSDPVDVPECLSASPAATATATRTAIPAASHFFVFTAMLSSLNSIYACVRFSHLTAMKASTAVSASNATPPARLTGSS